MFVPPQQLPLASQPWSPSSTQGRCMQVGSEPHYVLPHRRQSMLANLMAASSSAMHTGHPYAANEGVQGGDHRRRSEASIPPHRPVGRRSPLPLVFIPANIEKIKRTYTTKARERPQKPALAGRARSPRNYEVAAPNSRCQPHPPSNFPSAAQTTVLPPLSVALQQHSQSPSSMQLSLSPIRPASTEEAHIGTFSMSTPAAGPAYDHATPLFYGNRHEPFVPQDPHHRPYGHTPAAATYHAAPPLNHAASENTYRPPQPNLASPTTLTFNVTETDN
ncbi:hypothetical protein IWW57_004840, partial [Coemansia sp. S610]